MLKIIVIVLFCLVFIIGKLIDNSLLSINRIIPFMWCCLVIIPLLLWNINYQWKYWGLLWLGMAMISMELGAVLANKRKVVLKTYIESMLVLPFRKKLEYNYYVLLLTIILAFMGIVIKIKAVGYGLESFLSVDKFIKMNTEIAYLRYHGGLATNTVGQILGTLAYTATLLGGYVYNCTKRCNIRLLCIASFLPMVLSMLYTNTKSGFIADLFLWFIGYCISYLRFNGRLPIVSRKIFIGAIMGALLFWGLMVFFMTLRTGDFSSEMILNRSNEFFTYAFGGTAGFDYWFMDQINNEKPYMLGAQTYMAVFKNIGINCDSNYELIESINTNIFTSFRGVITDYGVLIGIVYCFIRGFVSQTAFNTIKSSKKRNYLAILLLSTAYFWGLYSFIISPWIYTTFILVFLSFLLLVFML